jgi:hypothetical protein
MDNSNHDADPRDGEKEYTASGSTRRTTPGIPPPSLIWMRRRRNQRVDRPVDASRPSTRRRTSWSWRGASTRRIGYDDDADCIGRYLRLCRLAGCLDSDPNSSSNSSMLIVICCHYRLRNLSRASCLSLFGAVDAVRCSPLLSNT